MRRIVIALILAALALSCLPSNSEAACGAGGRVLRRLRHPFGGNGVPVLRRLRG